MRTRGIAALAFAACIQAGCSEPQGGGDKTNEEPAAMTYPAAKRTEVMETQFGENIPDPYRWLENDPRQDRAVADWIAAERRTTSAYLDGLPGRKAFHQTLAAAYDYERLSAPQKAGTRYFYTRKDASRGQPALYMREKLDAGDRLLVDPARWSKDGSVALAEWRASPDGRRLAYAVQEGGSDWRTIRVLDVASGQPLPDDVKFARFTQIAWVKDGSGFYYSRFPEPKPGVPEGAGLSDHAVYFHSAGTPQSQDTLFYATPDRPKGINAAGITADGRYAIAYSSADLVHADVAVADLNGRDHRVRPLVRAAGERWSVVGNSGTTLFLMTDRNAPRSKIVSVDLAAGTRAFTDVVPQQDAILTGAYLSGDHLLATYLVDARSEVRRYTLDGKADGAVPLPGIGNVSAIVGEPGDREAFYVFASFNQPNTVYRYDDAANRSAPWVKPQIAADLGALAVRQVFFRSKDGTRVPMFVVRRRDVTGPAPTLLTGYGAFAINMPPAYSAMLTAWVLRGGTLAIPSIRGGGEYGAAWHAAGSGRNKQNGFDDFIGAAEFLQAQRITTKDGLAIYGDSAGGLLIGAVVNQRPDLFAAALPSVGVMDMLRFNRFTGGQLWVGEYGDPAVAADFRVLRAYSPYHNIRSGSRYPAMLVTTGEADNRVVPAHSFKYVAAIQAMNLGPRPRLLRIDAKAGHGAGKPTAQVIDEAADMWAFAARWTGLKVEDAR